MIGQWNEPQGDYVVMGVVVDWYEQPLKDDHFWALGWFDLIEISWEETFLTADWLIGKYNATEQAGDKIGHLQGGLKRCEWFGVGFGEDRCK